MASDSEDEGLKTAIKLSLQESNDSRIPTQPTATVPSSMLGLDRWAMEQERLARQKSVMKRERSESPPPLSRKAPKIVQTTDTLPSGARLTMFTSVVQKDQQARKPTNARAANSHLASSPVKVEDGADHVGRSQSDKTRSASSIKYPHGAIKKTWAFGHDRTGTEIKIEEVLEANTLMTAVLSAFQWDVEWVLSKLKTPLNGGSTKCLFVMQGKEEAMRKQMLAETEAQRNYLRLCFPSMQGMINCMHSKLMLLFHADKLRVAVPSANLLNFDWGETGLMENSVFIIDLPRLPEGMEVTIEQLTFFGKELTYFLERQGLPQMVLDGLRDFDFSATEQMAFIHTVGGMSFKETAHRTGLPGLARAVRHLNLQSDSLELDFAASSIGQLNEPYIQQFHAAARGENLIEIASTAGAKAKADFFKASIGNAAGANAKTAGSLRLYFPTYETVKASTAGAAGTICMASHYWESKTFPRTLFRDYRSTRPGLLSHNKIVCARGKRVTEATGQGKTQSRADIAWVYHGSANMSKSAWGEVVKDKSYGDWKTSCRNWECGVLLPVTQEKLRRSKGRILGDAKVKHEHEDGQDSETESEDEGPMEQVSDEPVGMEIFKGLIDVPFQVPGAEYGRRRPWFFKEDT